MSISPEERAAYEARRKALRQQMEFRSKYFGMCYYLGRLSDKVIQAERNHDLMRTVEVWDECRKWKNLAKEIRKRPSSPEIDVLRSLHESLASL